MALEIYCKVESAAIVARELKDSPVVKVGGDGHPIWRRVNQVARPTYDPATHHAPVQTQGSAVGDAAPAADEITEAWAAPVAKTQAELDADADAEKERQLDSAGAQKVMFLALLNHENRIRALEGKQSITGAQLRTALKELL